MARGLFFSVVINMDDSVEFEKILKWSLANQGMVPVRLPTVIVKQP
jgi:hypothetical protein